MSLRRWERAAGGAWSPLHDAWPGTIGKAGAAWGDGLHGSGAPPGRTGPVKHEGDLAAPAGAFALRQTYGYAAGAQSALGYQPLSPSWECVDDPKSSHYTQIVDRSKIASPDWTSSENMKREDVLYTGSSTSRTTRSRSRAAAAASSSTRGPARSADDRLHGDGGAPPRAPDRRDRSEGGLRAAAARRIPGAREAVGAAAAVD